MAYGLFSKTVDFSHDTCPVFPWTHHLAVNCTGLSAVTWEFTFFALNVSSSSFMWCFLHWKSSNWVPSNSRCSVILWPLHIELVQSWYDLPLETEIIYLIHTNEAKGTGDSVAHYLGCLPLFPLARPALKCFRHLFSASCSHTPSWVSASKPFLDPSVAIFFIS